MVETIPVLVKCRIVGMTEAEEEQGGAECEGSSMPCRFYTLFSREQKPSVLKSGDVSVGSVKWGWRG